MALDGVCFCSKVRRGARRLTRLYDHALAPSGLTVMQFAAMRAITRLDGPVLTTLARATGHERSAMWRTLRPLVDQGLVAMGGAPRRSGPIRVTSAGLERLASADPLWEAVQVKVAGALGEDAPALFDALARLEAIDGPA